MLAVGTGDVQAFEELVERHQAPLMRYFVRMGADRSIAEDCAQEVLIRVYKAREKYEPMPMRGTEQTPLRDAVAGKGDRFADRELLEEIERAVDALPEEQRMVLVLGLVQSLPYAEVSEILDIPVGTVKSRMHAAVGRVREALAGRVA
jgi:RNA polymerase sigma-70 factor (ECF subfamily)